MKMQYRPCHVKATQGHLPQNGIGRKTKEGLQEEMNSDLRSEEGIRVSQEKRKKKGFPGRRICVFRAKEENESTTYYRNCKRSNVAGAKNIKEGSDGGVGTCAGASSRMSHQKSEILS